MNIIDNEVIEKAEELYNYFRDDPGLGKITYPYTWSCLMDNRYTGLKFNSTIMWWAALVIKAQLKEMIVRYKILQDEINNDPLARGYAGMTNQQIVNSLLVLDRTRQIPTVSGAFIFERLDQAEVAALDAGQTARLDRILGLGDAILVQGQAKSELIALFGAGSNTIAALSVGIQETISRFTELGLSGGLSTQIIYDAKTGGF